MKGETRKVVGKIRVKHDWTYKHPIFREDTPITYVRGTEYDVEFWVSKEASDSAFSFFWTSVGVPVPEHIVEVINVNWMDD